MKKLIFPIIGIFLLILIIVAVPYFGSIKLNIINNSDYSVDFFSVKCGDEKIELKNLQPKSKVSKRLYKFSGQSIFCVFEYNNRNIIIGSTKSGLNPADQLSAINIIIENPSLDDKKSVRITNKESAAVQEKLKMTIIPIMK